MGGPMALNLACGHDIAIFSPNIEALNKLAAYGATTVSDPDGS
jgi:3-hydroxyisobutyrate dehydrogenase-like beta-hydroxyacid dehydrogenase